MILMVDVSSAFLIISSELLFFLIVVILISLLILQVIDCLDSICNNWVLAYFYGLGEFVQIWIVMLSSREQVNSIVATCGTTT